MCPVVEKRQCEPGSTRVGPSSSGVSSSVTTLPSSAVGASLTGVMVMEREASTVACPAVSRAQPGTRVPPSPEIVEASRIDPHEYRDSLQPVWTPGPLISEPYGRLIRLWSFVDDIVLDPFAGEGAAVPVLSKQLGRMCIAVELNEATCAHTAEPVREA
mgnify:CR=1 FL=1